MAEAGRGESVELLEMGLEERPCSHSDFIFSDPISYPRQNILEAERQSTGNYNLRITLSAWSKLSTLNQQTKGLWAGGLLWSKRYAWTGLPPSNLTCLHKTREKVESQAGSTYKTHTPPSNLTEDLSSQAWNTNRQHVNWRLPLAPLHSIISSYPTEVLWDHSKCYPVNNIKDMGHLFTLLDKYNVQTDKTIQR